MKKVYLRVLEAERIVGSKTEMDLFEGDIEKDRKYWKEHHNTEARYFELKEVKK